jgi:general secretion pathway protein N
LAPAGQILLQWPAYAPGADGAASLWDLQWRDAASALSTVHPLGDYRLQATRDGKGGAKLALSSSDGPLKLTAQGEWNGRRLHLNGIAEPAPGIPDTTRDALNALLSAIGRRNGDRSAFGTDQ